VPVLASTGVKPIPPHFPPSLLSLTFCWSPPPTTPASPSSADAGHCLPGRRRPTPPQRRHPTPPPRPARERPKLIPVELVRPRARHGQRPRIAPPASQELLRPTACAELLCPTASAPRPAPQATTARAGAPPWPTPHATMACVGAPPRPASECLLNQRRSAPRPAPPRPARERPTASAGCHTTKAGAPRRRCSAQGPDCLFFYLQGPDCFFSIYRDLIAFIFLYTDLIVFHFYMQGSLCKF
jgi:hypothetical protein